MVHKVLHELRGRDLYARFSTYVDCMLQNVGVTLVPNVYVCVGCIGWFGFVLGHWVFLVGLVRHLHLGTFSDFFM
jgi:hypothetical protein